MSVGEPLVTKAPVWQDSDAVLLARIRSISGDYLQQSDLTSISLTVYDQNDGDAVVTGPTALTISSVVYNTIQAWDGVLWSVDRTGWNFKYRIAGLTAFPLARDYRVVITFTLTDGTTFPVIFELTAERNP